MGKSRGRVASFDEMKMEKMSLPLLITSAYIEGIRMYGDFGVGQHERLMRRVELNYMIEAWLSPGMPTDSDYWSNSKKLKSELTYERARIPRTQTWFMRALSEWDHLLMKEQQRQRLLGTKTVAGRI